MCLPIVGLVIGIAASFAQAAMTSQLAQSQAAIEQQQLRIEMENERIAALGATNDRLEEFRRAESSNRAALSTMGLIDNISYVRGIAPYNKRVAYRDVNRIDFNAGQQIGRKKYEIAVAGWRAKAEGVSAFTSAAASAAGSIGGSDLFKRVGG